MGVGSAQVVKVFHGADSDILWLQRDFGIYVASLFDTGQASRILCLKSHGLAHLLRHYCGVIVRPHPPLPSPYNQAAVLLHQLHRSQAAARPAGWG